MTPGLPWPKPRSEQLQRCNADASAACLATGVSFLCRQRRAAGCACRRERPGVPVSSTTSASQGPGVQAFWTTAASYPPGAQAPRRSHYRQFMKQHLQLAHRKASCRREHFKQVLALWRLQSLNQPQCTRASRQQKRAFKFARKNADPKAAAEAAEAAKKARMENLKKAWKARAKLQEEKNQKATGVLA